MLLKGKKPELNLTEDCIKKPKIICTNHQIEYGLLNSYVITGIQCFNNFNFSINSGYLPLIELENIDHIIAFANKRKKMRQLFQKEFTANFPDWDDHYENEKYLYNTFQKLNNYFLKCLNDADILESTKNVIYHKKNFNELLDEFSQVISNHEHNTILDPLKEDLRELLELKDHYGSSSEKIYLSSRNITSAFIDFNVFITTKEMDSLVLLQYINDQ